VVVSVGSFFCGEANVRVEKTPANRNIEHITLVGERISNLL
jgi:hypothetical protein